MIQVVQLGLIDYDAALKLQQCLVELRQRDRIADTLLLLEHPAVITLGRNAKVANILASKEELERRGVQLFECDRGGDVTLHAPGQLVGYPIFDLRGFRDAQGNRKTLGAVEFVRRVEEALVRTCGDFGVPAERVAGCTGVWTAAAGHEPAKIAAIGLHISRSVTSHGFALNVNNDLELFSLIVPCGISNRPLTSIALEAGRQIKLQEVAHAVSRNFGRVFGRQIVWLQSLDHLLSSALPQNQDIAMRPPQELRRLHGDESALS